MKKAGKVFNPDEMELREVSPDWSTDELLIQEGIFFLKDLDEPLNISRALLYQKLKEIAATGKEPWEVMGVRKAWTHFQVRMIVFAPFYRKHLILPYAKIPENWDANSITNQTEGVYLLTEICRLIPFNTHQIRCQARTLTDAKKDMGVWMDKANKAYLVDLSTFAPWLRRTWNGGFSKEEPKPDK